MKIGAKEREAADGHGDALNRIYTIDFSNIECELVRARSEFSSLTTMAPIELFFH